MKRTLTLIILALSLTGAFQSLSAQYAKAPQTSTQQDGAPLPPDASGGYQDSRGNEWYSGWYYEFMYHWYLRYYGF